jgi:hypothetical protein
MAFCRDLIYIHLFAATVALAQRQQVLGTLALQRAPCCWIHPIVCGFPRGGRCRHEQRRPSQHPEAGGLARTKLYWFDKRQQSQGVLLQAHGAQGSPTQGCCVAWIAEVWDSLKDTFPPEDQHMR